MSTTVREEYEVGDLDPSAVLELAAHWADLHPATHDTGVETFGGAALLADESLGGDGTPAVAAFTPEPFALALGMSPSAGAQLIADALDLRHRLPMLWERLSRLEVPAWQARRVARQTHRLRPITASPLGEQRQYLSGIAHEPGDWSRASDSSDTPADACRSDALPRLRACGCERACAR